MKILVTGSAGHLGEALVRTLTNQNHEVIGIDRIDSDFTDMVGTLADREFVKPFSSLTYTIGAKGYHSTKFSDGPYPVDIGLEKSQKHNA